MLVKSLVKSNACSEWFLCSQCHEWSFSVWKVLFKLIRMFDFNVIIGLSEFELRTSSLHPKDGWCYADDVSCGVVVVHYTFKHILYFGTQMTNDFPYSLLLQVNIKLVFQHDHFKTNCPYLKFPYPHNNKDLM